MDSSAVANWIAAIGQAVGAIGTLAAVVVALSVSRRDGQRMERDQREKLASQARLITTRIEDIWNEISDGHRGGIVVTNNSAQSVVSLNVHEGFMEGSNLQWFPDGEASAGVEALHPGESRRFIGEWKLVGPSRSDSPYARTRIRFVDASGTWWDRTNNAEPSRTYPQS